MIKIFEKVKFLIPFYQNRQHKFVNTMLLKLVANACKKNIKPVRTVVLCFGDVTSSMITYNVCSPRYFSFRTDAWLKKNFKLNKVKIFNYI